MPNAALIVETALLILAAFLVGCVVGWLARRLTLPRPAAVAAAAEAPPAAPLPKPLVAAPVVAPLPLRPAGPGAAERLGLAAGRARPATEPELPATEPEPPGTEPELPVVELESPAAEAASLPAPEGGEPPATSPAPAPATVPRQERMPARQPGEVVQLVPPPGEEPAPPAGAVPATTAAVDPETAAREAIEGGWTPPPRLTPAPHPEPASDGAAAAEAAMAGARTALAAAQQAAAAVLREDAADAEPDRPVTATPRHGFGKPQTLEVPRDGGKDDLTRLRGITPALEAALNNLGIFHLDQIADWDRKAVVWVENHLGLRGRIARERWPEQARALTGKPVRPVRPRR